MPPLFAIAANDVDTAGREVAGELPIDWLDAELAEAEVKARAPGRMRVRLSRSGSEIVVRGQVAADVVLPCARCLDPAPAHLEGEVSLLLRPGPVALGEPPAERRAASKKGAPVAGKTAKTAKTKSETRAAGPAKAPKRDREPEHEFSAIDAELDTYDGETVVLDGFLREALLLELPNFPLCSEGCAGIAPAPPGAASAPEAVVDPRLAPLRALRLKLAEAGGEGRGEGEPPPAEGALARGRRPTLKSNQTKALKSQKSSKKPKRATPKAAPGKTK